MRRRVAAGTSPARPGSPPRAAASRSASTVRAPAAVAARISATPRWPRPRRGSRCGRGADTSAAPATGRPGRAARRRRAAGRARRPRPAGTATWTRVDEQLGPGVAQGGADGGHVRGAAGRQVAGAGPLHHRRGQGERAVHELLAHPGERPFPEAVAHVPGPAGQQQLGQRATRIARASRSTAPTPAPAPDLVDDPAEQPGAGQAGDRGQGVQGEYGGEGAAVGSDQAGAARRTSRGRRRGARVVRHRRTACRGLRLRRVAQSPRPGGLQLVPASSASRATSAGSPARVQQFAVGAVAATLPSTR